eukprot:TRINITY_DN26973_c0_g1_i1.p1 TRINITY_DN26973_c0_g1~~TRINITY_DN26973_c0_g1_i1.p1  ORF type:complete len:361 (+),score=80.02 TRINITY_DN26973_c0_g1_i1:96-1178(+)
MVEGRPVLPKDDVAYWAGLYGLCDDQRPLAALREFASYDDVMYHITTAEGEEYILKAHNGAIEAGSPSRLKAQNRLIERLRSRGLPVPAVVVAPSGEDSMPMSRRPGAPEPNKVAHVRVLTYLQGNILPNNEPKSDEFLQTVGAVCGRITRALEGFEDEGARWDWDWNMKHVASVCEAKLHFVSDPARRDLAREFVASYRAAFSPEVLASLPHSVIHSDLNDTNLLFDEGKVVGVLDFGDSIYACTVFDVGVAAGYYALGQADPLRVFAEVLRGYLREASLSAEELSVFYHAAYGRVLLSVCMSAQQTAAEPDNEYLAHTSEPGWAVLTQLRGVSAEAALERFRAVVADVRNGSGPGSGA